jgi:hypothetical protein
MAVLLENSPGNYVSRESGDTIIFTGSGNTLSLSNFGATDAFCYGTDQLVSVSIQGADNAIYDFGTGTNLLVGEPFYPLEVIAAAQLTIYDFQRDPTAKVTLLPFASATQTPDGHGGTWLSVGTAGEPASFAAIHFVYDPHVTVVSGTA